MITHGDITIKIEESGSLPAAKSGGDSIGVGSNMRLRPGQQLYYYDS